jgi:hypothetical protein
MNYLGVLGLLVPSLVALWIATLVTWRVANMQLKKELFDRRYKIFEETVEFMRPILSSPSNFTSGDDGQRKFWGTMQSAKVLFGRRAKVYKFLEDIDKTATNLCASQQTMNSNRGDNDAITENGQQFQHLSELWEKQQEDAFLQDLDLSQAGGSNVTTWLICAGLSVLLVVGVLIAAAVAPPKKTATPSKTELLDLKVKCEEVGAQYAEALKKGGEDTGQFATQPRFGYSADLNTCIIRAGYLNLKTRTQYKFLADSLTGETLVEVFDNNPAKQAEFSEAEARLMGPPESNSLKVVK